MDWNNGAEIFFGVSRKDALGRDFAEFVELSESDFKEVIEGNEKEFQEVVSRKLDGSKTVVKASFYPLRSQSGECNAIVMVGAEAVFSLQSTQVIESSDMYRSLSESASIGVCICFEDRFLYVNEQMSRITGYRVEELLKMLTSELVAPEDRERIDRITELREAGEAAKQTYSFRIIRKDGKRVCIDLHARDILYQGKKARLCHCIEITERMHAQEELRKITELYRSTIESMDDIVHVIDKEMNLVMYNHVMEKWASEAGIDLKKATGKSLFEVLPFLGEQIRDDYREVFEKGKVLVTNEKAERRDKTMITEVRKIPVKDKEGNVERVVTVIRDITEKNHSEKFLKASEELYRSTINAMGELIHVVDRNLRIIMYNLSFKLWTAELGMKLEDVKGRLVMEVFPFLSGKVFEEYMEVLKIGKPLVTHESNTISGRVIYTETRKIPVKNNKGEVERIVTVVRDITELKRAEQGLKLTNLELTQERNLFVSGPVVVFKWQNRKGWPVEYVSSNVENVLGYSAEDWITGVISYEDLIFEDDLARVSGEVNKYSDSEATSFNHEPYRLVCKDRRIIWVDDYTTIIKDDKGNITHYLGYIVDITERKTAEEALRKSEERYRNVTESIEDVIFSLTPAGEVIFVSGACEKIFGVSPESLVGKNLIDAASKVTVSKEEIERLVALHAENVAGKKEFLQYEFVFEREHEKKTLEIKQRMVYDKNGRLVNSFGILRDISDRKNAEQEIERTSQVLKNLLDISTEVSSNLNEEDVVNVIAERATELLRADGCTVYRMDPETDELVPKTTTIKEDREKRLSYRIPMGKGITGKAATERRAIIANDVEDSDDAIRIPGTKDLPRCLLVAPLIAQGELWGMMTLVRFNKEHFIERDLELLSLFANQVADAALNSTLFSLLVESEEKYRSFVEQALDGITIVQDGNIVFANQSVLRSLGYEMDDILNKDFFHIIAPGSRDLVKDRYLRRMKGENTPSVYETQLITKDGKILDVEVNAGIIRYAGRPADLVFARDIRERKIISEALRASEEFNRTVIEHSPLGVSVRSRTGKLLSVNKAWKRIWGISAEVLKKDMDKERSELHFDESDSYLGEWLDEIKKVYENGGYLHIPKLEIRKVKSSSPIWISHYFYAIKDPSGDVERVVILTEDITERIKAEEALRESEERYRKLVSLSPEAIIILLEGKIVFANNAAVRMLGASDPKELMGRPGLDFVHPYYKDIVSERMSKVENDGVSHPFLEEKLIALDGKELIVDSISIAFTYQGKPAVQLVAHDITARKRVEEALKESEELYRSLVETSPDAIVLSDLDNTIVKLNLRAALVLGVETPADLVGMNVLDFFVPEDRQRAKENAEKTLSEGKTLNIEYTGLQKDGTKIPIELSTSLVTDADGKPKGFISVARDITERKLAEQALAESEQKYHAISDMAAFGVIIHKDGKPLFANPMARKLLGYGEDEDVSGVSIIDDVIVSEDRKKALDIMEKRKSGAAPPVYDIRVKTKGGKIKTIEISGERIRYGGESAYMVSFVDITERKKAEEALRDSEERYRSVVETAKDAIVSTDSENRIIFWNREAQSMFGYSDEEIVGKPLTLIIPAGFREEHERGVAKIAEGGDLRYEGAAREGFGLRKDKTEFPIEFSVKAWKTAEGTFFTAIFRDVTERKHSEEALAKSEERYRLISESANDLITLNDESMKFLYHNVAVERILGFTSDEISKSSVLKLVHPDDRKAVAEAFVDAWSNKRSASLELRIGKKDGTYIWIESKGRPLFDEGGKVNRALIISRDITDRKLAEEALRESEERYRNLFQQANDAILVASLEGRILAANQKLSELCGFSEEELLSRNFGDIVAPEMTGIIPELLRQVKTRGGFFGEGVGVRKNGVKFPLEVSGSLIPWGKGQGMLVFLRDIGERKQAEEAVREGERFLASIFASIQDGLSILDNDLNIVRVNPTMEKWYDYAMPLTGKKCYEAYHSRNESCASCPTLRTRETGEKDYEVVPKRGPKGEIIGWLELYSFPLKDLSTGKMKGLIEYVRDITDRKEAEEALREREELYRTLVHTAQEGISLVDPQEKILFVNPKMAELLGYLPEELTGRTLTDFMSPKDTELIIKETQRRKKGETSRYEITLYNKDKIPREVLVNAAPIFEADGKLYATLGVLTDISDIKKAEEKLRLRLLYQIALSEILNRAIKVEEFDKFLMDSFKTLGRVFATDRVYLATNLDRSESYRITHEWFKEGESSLYGSDYEYSGMRVFYDKLAKDELVVAYSNEESIEKSLLLKNSKAQSGIFAPLKIRDGFYGFIGVCNSQEFREWTEFELEEFQTFIRLISTVMDRFFEEQERRFAENALSESEERYRTLVETSTDIIFLLTTTGQVLYVSPATKRLGYNPGDIIRNPANITKAIPQDELVTLKAIFTKTLRQEHSVHEIDTEVYDAKGNRHWFSLSWNWIRNDKSEIIAVQGIARDISERKETERALRLRMEYEKALFEVSSLFLAEGVSDTSIHEFLERLGRVTEVSRVYMFSHDRDEEDRLCMRRTHRWVSEASSSLDNDSMDKIYYDQGFERWLTKLSTGEDMHGLVGNMPPIEKKLFTQEGIVAFLVLPIFVEGRFWGAIGFDEAREEREWDVEDIRLIWTASQSFSSALATESKARELAMSYENLRERERQITDLHIRLVKAEEEERRRIARVLHDEIAQQLTGIALLLSTPEFNLTEQSEGRIKEAKDMVKETQKFIRDLSYDLRPPALDNLGLLAAVRALARSVALATGVSFDVEAEEEIPRTEPETEIMLYRIIQEAVNNALKHAEPEEIRVIFKYRKPVLTVGVSDDGKGFELEKVAAEHRGIGLNSMHERVALIGGRMEVSSAPGRGTQLKVEVEIKPNVNILNPEE